MRICKIYIIVVVLICSCSLLTRTVKTTNEDSQKANSKTNVKAKLALDKAKTMQYLYRGKDSMLSAYQIQLWPKGKIVVNDAFNLEGEFDSILMKGNLRKSSTQEATALIDEQDKSKMGLAIGDQSSSNFNNKAEVKEQFPNYVWLLIGGVLLLTALAFIIKSLK